MKSYIVPVSKIANLFDCLIVAHGQSDQFSAPLTQSFAFDGTPPETCSLQAPGFLEFNFDVSGLAPNGPGRLIVVATGDIGRADGAENYTIQFEGIGNLSPVVSAAGAGDGGIGADCHTSSPFQFNLSQEDLENAASDGTIQVTAIPSAEVGCFCPDAPGEEENEVTVTLEFPGTSS
jgi:hypothetical protein